MAAAALLTAFLRAAQLPKRSSHPFLLIKIFPNDTIESHAIITMIAAPHLYLSRSFAPGISFVTDACAVAALGTLASATPAAEILCCYECFIFHGSLRCRRGW